MPSLRLTDISQTICCLHIGTLQTQLTHKIRTPYNANLNEQVITPNVDYTFGDGNPNEWEWKTSAQYLYDQLIISFKCDPINFNFDTFNGTKLQKVNCLNVDDTSKKVFSHKDTLFHGDIDSNGNPFYSNGLNQWYVDYNRYHAYDGEASQFRAFWQTWDTQLSYLIGSYINTPSLNIDNENFDITDKDYKVYVKKTFGYNDISFDSLIGTVLNAPSKYSKTRNLGTGWTVQFGSTSPSNNNISYYPKENFGFRSVLNNPVFEISVYDIVDAGIAAPSIISTVSYSESADLSDLTNYTGKITYTANVVIGSQVIPLALTQNKCSNDKRSYNSYR